MSNDKLKPTRFGQSTADWLVFAVLTLIGLIIAGLVQRG